MPESKPKQPKIPAHVQAANDLKERIFRIGYRVGDELPSYEQLTRQLGVSYVTVKKMMDILGQEGIVRVRYGKGSVLTRLVADPGPTISHIAMIYTSTRHGLSARHFFTEIFQGMLLEAHVLHADINQMSLRDNPDLLTTARLNNSGIQGLILFDVQMETVVQKAIGLGLPMVAVDNYIPTAPIDAVVVDNNAAVWSVMEHLAGLGHRHIHYVTSRLGAPDLQTKVIGYACDDLERQTAYQRFMVERGWEHYAMTHSWPDFPSVQKLRAGTVPPTALLVDHVPTAAALIGHLRHGGVDVPADVSVAVTVCCTEERFANGEIITCSRAFFAEMGRQAVRLLNRARGQSEPPRFAIHRIGSRLEPGQTTAPARRS